ncbi:MAG TPA: hypothetical protein VGT06_02455 [Candidatus Methylomirabilis sp.]|nr:hypothetical protein [Candidatus Methylomirabilis sp.]
MSPLRVTGCLLVLAIYGVLLTAGCTPTSQAGPDRGTAIVIFVDFSQSIRSETRALFRQDIESRIIPSLSPGDRLLIASISDKTLTEFRPLVEATFPPRPSFNGFFDNVLNHNRKVKEIDAQAGRLREEMAAQVADVFGRRLGSPQTDIFSSLVLAQKLFHDEPRRKVLVLMSDMIEDLPPYRFEQIKWNPATHQKILTELAERGLMPDLSSVCVYVSGASAQSADTAGQIGDFWRTYFERSKADMDPSRYAHVLLHWPPPKTCGV